MPEPVLPPSPEVAAASQITAGALFAAVARRFPDRTALIAGAKRRTYGELNERVNKLCAVLSAKGVQRGDRIGLLARNGIEYLEIELAAAKLGVISAALNWRLQQREMDHCVQLADPAIIVVEPQYEAMIEAGPSASCPRLVIGPGYEAQLSEASADEPSVPVHPEDGMLIIYTSGTTGLPKGALISHRAMMSRAMIYASETAAPKDANYLAWTPLFHMGASDFSHASLMRGGTVYIVDGYQPEELAAVIAADKVHYFALIPGMIEQFIEYLEAHPTRPVGIEYIGAMADLVPRHQLARITELLEAQYMNTFGSTETGTPPASAGAIAIGDRPTDLAKAITNFCEVRLVDADDRDVPDGEPGELIIRGPSLFSGYWRNDEANAEAFRGGWFHMGDVFRREPDGRLNFVDRVKYMIKSGGENIYPAEIEQVVLADDRVIEAAVVRRPDDRWGEVPVIFVARNDESFDKAALIDCCREHLAGYKLPKDVFFIGKDDFPRSSSGKVERHTLEGRLEQVP